mmetsp:Transcript_64047/g.170977  ORF Transcript_64047/g.170977 Transcript_64047/m.170977 type:complete len:207 (+) Transcript_64047:189-809(+)
MVEMCFFKCWIFCFAFMPLFRRTSRLFVAIMRGLLRWCSALVLPPLRSFRRSCSFSLKSMRPAFTLARRAALVRSRAGAPRSSSAEMALGMRPVRPRSSSASASEASDPESEEISSALRLRPSCSSTERWSRALRSFWKSSLLSTRSAGAAPAGAAAPPPSSSRPSMPSAAGWRPYWGAWSSPRLRAMVASLPRSERCSSSGLSSR